MEVNENLRKVKNWKALGTDNIPNEPLKYGGRELARALTALFNKVLNTIETPNDWHTSTTIPVFKKGQNTSPENYRGITLLNTTMKLFTGLLKDRIEKIIINREEQQGFRKSRSTTDAIFITKQIKEKAIKYNTPAFNSFVDLTKAFDRVQLGDIIKMLMEKETPANIVKVISNLNTINATQIKAGQHTTKSLPTPGGIRQEDILSPFLFNLIMDKIIEEVATLNMGYRMNNNRISMVCYADDAAIFAETEGYLQRQLLKVYQASQQLNMSISIEKIKSITIATKKMERHLAVYIAGNVTTASPELTDHFDLNQVEEEEENLLQNSRCLFLLLFGYLTFTFTD